MLSNHSISRATNYRYKVHFGEINHVIEFYISYVTALRSRIGHDKTPATNLSIWMKQGNRCISFNELRLNLRKESLNHIQYAA